MGSVEDPEGLLLLALPLEFLEERVRIVGDEEQTDRLFLRGRHVQGPDHFEGGDDLQVSRGEVDVVFNPGPHDGLTRSGRLPEKLRQEVLPNLLGVERLADMVVRLGDGEEIDRQDVGEVGVAAQEVADFGLRGEPFVVPLCAGEAGVLHEYLLDVVQAGDAREQPFDVVHE